MFHKKNPHEDLLSRLRELSGTGTTNGADYFSIPGHIDSSISRSAHISDASFSTRNDYEQYFISKGLTADALWNNDYLVEIIQRHWHSKGQNGCLFAQAMAHKNDVTSWRRIVLPKVTELNLIKMIDTEINLGIADSKIEALSLLFPDVTEPAPLINLLSQVKQNSQTIRWMERVDSEKLLVSLRIPINEKVLSWVVGFGPFDFFPETRRAPITELAIRTKVKPENQFFRLNSDENTAHLADIPIGLSDDVMERLWIATTKRTQNFLGGVEAREMNKAASAKVTFSIPQERLEGSILK